jgi:hypothetical protein
MKKTVVAHAIMVAMIAGAPLVTSQEARAADVMHEEGEARFKEGVRLMKEGKYDEARLKFQQSYAVAPVDSVLINLALAEKGANMPVEALTHLRKYLASTGVEAKKKEARAGMLAQLEQQTSRIRIKGADALRVKVDGFEVPAVEQLDVMPGVHKVDAGELHREVNLAAGEMKVVDFTAQSSVAPVPSGPLPAPSASTTPSSSPPGPSPSVDVAPPPSTPESNSKTKWIVSGSVAGAGVVAVGVGVAFTAMAGAAKSDLDGKRASLGPGACPNGSTAGACSGVQSAAEDVKSKGTASVVSYVIGGALIAGGVGTYLLWPTKAEGGANAWLAPYVDRGGSGVVMGGSF